ncbi:MAG: hypothetical protein HUU35_15445, partial [Armatimonadetes bacterium]|nr:hypothetical protein [Armatimonadota bacterium]
GLLVQIPGLTGWDTLTAPFGASPFAEGDSLTVIDVRGTPGEAITLEWKEQDGSRWIARVPLATSWTRHVLEPTDFEFWPDGSPATRAGGHLNPQAVRALSFGPAVGHGATRGKAIEYAVGPIGVGPSPLADRSWLQPHLETLSPWYKQAVTTIDKRAVRVPIPRQRGLTAAAEMDGRYLALGNLLKPFASRYATVAGAALVWLPDATLGAKESEQVADLLRRGGEGIFVLNSGPRAVVLDPSQPVELAARLTHGGAAAADLQVNWQVFQGSKAVREHSAAVTLQPGAMRGVTAPNPAPLPAGDYRLQTSVTLAGKLVDVAETHLRVVVPTTPSGQRVTVEGGRFAVDGKRLFLHGVNFWPRYVSGQERDRYWSHWLSPRNYDPEVVEADLKAVAGLGMNLVSVQYNALDQAPAMRDLLARARRHGLWVNVYLGGAHPLSFDPLLVSRLLTEGRLCGDPTVFAYDLAWEPRLGVHQERRRYDAAWRAWLDEQYGSLAAAEVAWGTAAPREAGQATNPLDEQITSDGPHRTMVAAYRRFVDDLASRGYRRVVQYIQRLDPEALLGARTGYGGTGQPGANRVMAYDLLAGAAWLSFTSPEGYGLPPTFEEGRRTGLVTHYGRWAGNGAPVFWSEFGASLGPRGGTPETRHRQEGIWETMLRVISDSDADASAGWWWPGGWRIDERSDYGVMAPDGTIRESARIGARLAKRIQESGNDAGRGEPVRLNIDRDADARGLTGLLERTAEGYLKARAEGRPVRLVTAGTGTTTATMPLVQVGNVPYQGTGPLKYANAEVEGVRAEWPGGSAEANTGDTIAVPAGAVCRLIVRLRNTGEAAWLNSSGRGACRLETTHGAAAIT